MTEITRRRLLRRPASARRASASAAQAATWSAGDRRGQADGTGTVPFYGEHQAGIDTPAQDRLHFAAFDLVDRQPARTCAS